MRSNEEFSPGFEIRAGVIILLLLKIEAWPYYRGEIISGGKSEGVKFMLLGLLLPGIRHCGKVSSKGNPLGSWSAGIRRGRCCTQVWADWTALCQCGLWGAGQRFCPGGIYQTEHLRAQKYQWCSEEQIILWGFFIRQFQLCRYDKCDNSRLAAQESRLISLMRYI